MTAEKYRSCVTRPPDLLAPGCSPAEALQPKGSKPRLWTKRFGLKCDSPPTLPSENRFLSQKSVSSSLNWGQGPTSWDCEDWRRGEGFGQRLAQSGHPAKWLLLYWIYSHPSHLTSVLGHIQALGVQGPGGLRTEAGAGKSSCHPVGVGSRFGGFLCTNRLRVCVGSPDQSWFSAQGSLLSQQGSHPGTASCSCLAPLPPQLS